MILPTLAQSHISSASLYLNSIKSFVMRWVSNKISLFVGYLELNKIAVLPNVRNQIKRRIHVEDLGIYNGKRYDPELGGRENLFGKQATWWWKPLGCCDNIMQMDRSIVKEAIKVLSQKKNNRIEEQKQNEIFERIRNIEKCIANISEKINALAIQK